MNIKSHRKANVVAELLEPYRPEDFAGFTEEWLAGKAKKEVNTEV
jgi:hypothetical protein